MGKATRARGTIPAISSLEVLADEYEPPDDRDGSPKIEDWGN